MNTTRSRLAAALVAAAALTVPVAAAHADPLPPIAPAPTIHAKFILPPKTGNFSVYNNIRAAAIAAGYDVVENDGVTPAV